MYNQNQIFGDQFKAASNTQKDFEESYWIRWSQIGQKVFGTYLGSFIYTDDYGKEIPCYKFRGGQGCQSEVSKVGVMDLSGKVYIIMGKKFIDMQMEGVVPGQVIGAEYEKDVPTKHPSPAKSIVLHKPTVDGTPDGAPLMDPNVELEELAANFGGKIVQQPDVDLTPNTTGLPTQPNTTGVPAQQSAPATGTGPFPPIVQSGDPLGTIKQLALTKLPIATEDNWKEQVMEATGLYLGEQNYQAIITKLSQTV